MMNEASLKFRLWAEWTIATLFGSISGYLLGAILIVGLTLPFHYSPENDPYLAAMVTAVFGIPCGFGFWFFQRQVLKNFLGKTVWWFISTSTGWALSWWILARLADEAEKSLQIRVELGIISGVLIGSLQVLAIFKKFTRAWLWIIATTLSNLIFTLFIFRIEPVIASLFYFIGSQLLSGGISGIVLVHLTTHSNLLEQYQPSLFGINRVKRMFLNPLSIFVAYALFDFIWTAIRVELAREDAEGADINYAYSPMQMAVMSGGALLIAALALRLSRFWSLPIAIGVSGKLLREGWKDYQFIAEDFGMRSKVPKAFTETLQFWWCYQGGNWQVPRLIIAALILVCAVVLLLRKIWQRFHSRKLVVE
jgi:hypothetical protein